MNPLRIIILAVLVVLLTAGVAGAAANSCDLCPRLEKFFDADGAKCEGLTLHTVVEPGFNGTVIQRREVRDGATIVSRNALVFSRTPQGDVLYYGDLYSAVHVDPVVWVDEPLTVGKTWSDSTPLDPTGMNPGTVHYVFAVLEEAEITCPAGTFMCQRVFVATIRPDGTTQDCNYWYSSQCGLIRCEMDGVGTFVLHKAILPDDLPDVEIHDPPANEAVTGLSLSPNPARPTTGIRFDLQRNLPVTVEVYDVSGRLVRRLASGEVRDAGPAVIRWDGRDETGREAASGLYIARVRAGGTVANARMVLVR
jgi:hypothetical protein